MPRTCTVCRHSRCEEIELALMASEPLRRIGRRNSLSTTALFRHKTEHLPRRLQSVVVTADEVGAGTLFDRLRELNQATWEILQECRATGNHHTALAAIGRIERQIQLEARLKTGSLRDAAKVAMGMGVPPEEANFDHVPTEQLTEARDLMERVRAILAGPTANGCEEGLSLSLAARTTPEPRQILIAAPPETGNVRHESAASHWTD